MTPLTQSSSAEGDDGIAPFRTLARVLTSLLDFRRYLLFGNTSTRA